MNRTTTIGTRAARGTAGALLLLLAAAPGARGQNAPPPSPGSACALPELRQFDFWIGEWEVRDREGTLLGRNEIRRTAGGCALLESWRGASGASGISVNTYEAGRWHQVWVGSGGLVLRLTGGIEDGAMVLAGKRDTPEGALIDRIRWTPLPNGGVEQRWDVSRDGGATWRVVFLGVYRRS